MLELLYDTRLLFWRGATVHRLRTVRSTLALTKRMVWSASTTTLKNTTILQCSTKLIRRWGSDSVVSMSIYKLLIKATVNSYQGISWNHLTREVFFSFADVEMYRAGWKTKVHGSRNHCKPTICAEGETTCCCQMCEWEFFSVLFGAMYGCNLTYSDKPCTCKKRVKIQTLYISFASMKLANTT